MSPLVGPHTAPGGIWKGEAWENDMQGGGLVHQWLLAGWGKSLSRASYNALTHMLLLHCADD